VIADPCALVSADSGENLRGTGRAAIHAIALQTAGADARERLGAILTASFATSVARRQGGCLLPRRRGGQVKIRPECGRTSAETGAGDA